MDYEQLIARLDRIEQKQNYILGNQKTILEWQDNFIRRRNIEYRRSFKQLRINIYKATAIAFAFGVLLTFV